MFGRPADADASGAGLFHRVQVFAEVALECQDAIRSPEPAREGGAEVGLVIGTA